MKELAEERLPDHQQLLIHKIIAMEPRYNPELRLLRSPFSSPGYHTTIQQAEFIHSTRDSLSYALGLLDTELAVYEQRAFDIIGQVVSLQDTDRSRNTFGIWSWFYEEPLAQMSPPDWNWADFCGSRLLLALSRHRERFPAALRDAAGQAVLYACEAIVKRDVGPDYTNIAILGAFVTRIAGEVLGQKSYAEYGLERLRKLYDYTVQHGVFQEYNSPVYTGIAILELSKLRAGTTDIRVRELSDELLHMTWKTVAEHYHPGTRQWSGPHSRCYQTLLGSSSQAFLQVATGGKLMFFPWEELPYEEEWYKSGVSCPAAYAELFTLPATKELKVRYEGGEAVGEKEGREAEGVKEGEEAEVEKEGGKAEGSSWWATTYMTPKYSIGTFSSSDFWNQRRPLLAYVDNDGSAACIRLRCLHDGYDYCSARFKASQEQGHVLFGIDFITNGGDTHPNLDRIDGAIEAEDFRLRFEIEGNLVGITVNSAGAGAVIQIGDLKIRLQRRFAAFTEQAGEEAEKQSLSGGSCKMADTSGQSWDWEIRKTADTLEVDVIIYAGPRKSIDFRKLEQAAFVFSLDMGQVSAFPEPLIQLTAAGRLSVSYGAGQAEAFPLNLRPGRG